MSQFTKNFSSQSIKIGRLTYLIVMLASFAPCIYLVVFHGAHMTIGDMLAAWGGVAITYGAFYIVEPFSYYPILGMTGTYMGIVSGNIANMRLPASATAQEAVGVEQGTDEADVVSTLGIAGSIITNLIVLTIAIALGSLILNILPEPVQLALQNYVLPGIFGAMVGQFAVQKPKVAAYCIALCLIVRFVFPSLPPYVYIIVAIFGNMLISRLMYKKGFIS